MAKMLPTSINPNTKSPAEHKLFAAFEKLLSDQYTVFHSVRWQLPGYRGMEDGETDFIIAHPTHGILIVEVKGGAIGYDGTTGKWMSGANDITDPIDQAIRSKYSLIELMKKDSWFRNEKIYVGHAVAFPDVAIEGNLLPELPRAIVLDAKDLKRLDDWASQAFGYWRDESDRTSSTNKRYIEVLSKILSPSWDFQPRLAQQFDEEERQIKALTEGQLYILDVISRERRAAIAGCAGSGKTILAMEKAIRLSESGFNVAFVCFNRNLAEHIERMIGSLPSVEVATFHALCDRLCRDAGIKPPREQGDNYFSEILPGYALEAVDKLGPRYDAIVVDEGQDFAPNWWLILDSLLRAGEQDVFYIFFDDNQLLYQERMELPLEVADLSLTKNLRNTQNIHNFAKQFYRSDQSTTADGPEGRPVEFLRYGDERELHKTMRKTLHRLIVNEGIDAADIVILTPKSRTNSALWRLAPFGNFHLIHEPPGGGAEVYCTTVHSFKGLERSVVILVELDQEANKNLQTLLYVGSTRACNHLIVMGNSEFISNASS